MKHTLIMALFVNASSLVVHAGLTEDKIALKAVGAEDWNDKNDNGVKCLNYSRGNHRLRLEDVVLQSQKADSGRKIWGTFTVTNRRRGKSDPHVFVDISVKDGKVEHLKLRSDGGGGWLDVLPNDLISKKVKGIEAIVAKLGTNGDAQSAMASSVWAIIESLSNASTTTE